MKKIAFLVFALAVTLAGFGQTGTEPVKFPQYINDGKIPGFSIISAPDSAVFTHKNLKPNKPTLIMVFSPECGHCQEETKAIEANMEHFKDVQILMVTWVSYKLLVPFSRQFGTVKYPNITLAYDAHDFFYDYYDVHRYPKVIIYNKDGQYVSDYDGMFDVEDVWKDLGF